MKNASLQSLSVVKISATEYHVKMKYEKYHVRMKYVKSTMSEWNMMNVNFANEKNSFTFYFNKWFFLNLKITKN